MHRIQSFFILNQMLIKRNTVTSYGPSRHNSRHLFTMNDMPKPKYLPLIGTRLDFMASGSGTKLHEYVDSRHKQLGSIFCEKLGGNTDLVFVSDPALIRVLFMNLDGKYPAHILPDPWLLYEKLYGSKRGLLFMNGSEWLENRRIMNKHLLKEDSESWLEVPVKTTIETFIQRWKSEAAKGVFVPNLESEFYRLSIDVIIAVMLGSNSLLKTNIHYETLLNLFSDSVKKIFQTTTKLYGMPVEWYQRFNLKLWRDFKECVDMSLLLAHKIVSEMLNYSQESNGLMKKLTGENITDENIQKIVADLIIAAGDTTSYTSLWTLYLLSINECFKNELHSKDHAYMKYVVKESMRLYPVAPFLTRILPKESVLGSYILHEGTPIIASIYTSGRDEQNFSKANEFLPYRWDRNDPRRKDLKNHVSSASLPFALGARSCVGKKLAMLQITELLTQIVENFDFKCLDKNEVTPITSQVLVPNKSVNLEFTLRNPNTKV